MVDTEVNFSFLKQFNSIKNVFTPVPYSLPDPKDKFYTEKYSKFQKWCDDNGIEHPKLKYPALFGTGESKYPGMVALDDIGKDEIMIKVPSHMVLSTKIAY